MTSTLVPTSITCADCAQPHVGKRSNVKYCHVCRLFRNLVYIKSRRHTCASCEEKFAPLHVNDKLCADCDFLQGRAVTGKCAFCAQTKALIAEGVAICLSCGKDPKQRDTVLKAVGKKRRGRTKAASSS